MMEGVRRENPPECGDFEACLIRMAVAAASV